MTRLISFVSKARGTSKSCKPQRIRKDLSSGSNSGRRDYRIGAQPICGMSNAGKNKPQVITALGRELLGFVWAIAVHVEAQLQPTTC
jgi:hypothetical protein